MLDDELKAIEVFLHYITHSEKIDDVVKKQIP